METQPIRYFCKEENWWYPAIKAMKISRLGDSIQHQRPSTPLKPCLIRPWCFSMLVEKKKICWDLKIGAAETCQHVCLWPNDGNSCWRLFFSIWRLFLGFRQVVQHAWAWNFMQKERSEKKWIAFQLKFNQRKVFNSAREILAEGISGLHRSMLKKVIEADLSPNKEQLNSCWRFSLLNFLIVAMD